MPVTWTPCDLEPGDAAADCATLAVPLDADDPDGPTLDIALKRIPAAVQPARGQLWFVTGGPGDAGTDDLAHLAGFDAIAADLDVVTLDHRGVGGSTRLGCPDQEAADSPDGYEITADEWPACAAYVGTEYAGFLPYVTVTAAAGDLVRATDAVAGPDDVVIWWGVSYGTFLVERALHLAPDRPDGVIVDGLVPPDWSFVEFDAGLDLTAHRLLDACGDDPGCAAHFDPDPLAVAERALEPGGRCEKLGLDPATSRLLAGVLEMPGVPYATLVPSMWARMDRCDHRDRRAFVHLFDRLFPEDGGGLGEKPGHSPVLQRHIAYAELWDADADPAVLHAALDDVIATTAVSASFADGYASWPLIPPDDPRDGEFPPTDVPVLALHGGLDPTMPIERIAGFDGWLTGPSQQVVRVPLAQHVTFNAGDCPQGIYAQFLADPQAALDTSCIAGMPALDWDGDDAFNEDIWGTTDRWNDGGCGCGTARGGGGLGMVGAGLVVVGTRRARTRAFIGNARNGSAPAR
jgi:pimeloyl-ACP methyl ester carboxylesterase